MTICKNNLFHSYFVELYKELLSVTTKQINKLILYSPTRVQHINTLHNNSG